MTRFILIAIYLFLIGCSFSNSDFWTEDKTINDLSKNSSKIFKKTEIIKNEFNPNLKITLLKNKSNIYNSETLTNDLGISLIKENINKLSKFNFSKIDNFDYFETEINFDGNNSNQQYRFITLIDIIYEKKIPLMVTSQLALNLFKSSKKLSEPFKRTISRLYELTSMAYK